MDLSYLQVGRHQLVMLSAVGQGSGDGADQLRAALRSVAATLAEDGLGLEHVVRSRLWAQDAESRSAASPVRPEVLAGPARSASSSYVCPSRLPAEALVSIDVVARRPRPGETVRKVVVERDPVEVPIRYLMLDDLIVFAGVTSVAPTLEEQVDEIATSLTRDLTHLGSEPAAIAHLGCYLQRAVNPAVLAAALSQRLPDLSVFSIELVNGFSAPGKLVEIEVTALSTSSERDGRRNSA